MQIDKIGRPTRLLRVREPGEPRDKRPEGKPAPSGKSRFVAPHYFDAEQQATILNLLERAGVGDAEGRRLFLTAAEYEIGAYSLLPREEPAAKPSPKATAPSQDRPEWEPLREAALDLAKRLAETRPSVRDALAKALTASDPFGRDHGGCYLSQLQLELQRLGEACGPLAVSAAPVITPAPISAQARRFILQIARIYRECLEVNPTSETLGPFARLLCLFRDRTQLDIPCESERLGPLLLDLK